MSTKTTRSGGKFSGSHTTVIPAAGIVADIAAKQDEVTKISLAFINAGLRPTKGNRRVKITDEGSRILLAVRDNTSHQKISVISQDKQKTKIAIARAAHDAGLTVSLQDEK